MAIESGELVQTIGEYEGISRETQLDVDSVSNTLVNHILSSPSGPKIAILIPAFNEELTIGSVVLQARRYAHHVLVINDGSADKTSEVARMAGAEVIDHHINGGKASALSAGFNELKKRNYDIIVMMDGDGQHLVQDIGALIAPIIDDESDLVIGSRFMKKDNSIPLYRQIGQRILNRATNVGSSKRITDTQSGFRALNKKALQNMNFQSSGYAVEQDMILHCSEQGLRISETPISVRYDVPNGHKQGSLSMGMGLLNNVVATIGYKRPLLLFGVPGALLCAIGLVIGILTILDIYFIGSWLMQSLMAGFMVMVGSTLAVSGFSLNSLSMLMRTNMSK
jgi:glycosyltransferase involved in cell wall biosynthesis